MSARFSIIDDDDDDEFHPRQSIVAPVVDPSVPGINKLPAPLIRSLLDYVARYKLIYVYVCIYVCIG